MVNFFINCCEFGSITVNQNRYDSDLIITTERIVSDWWRNEGHNLSLQDLIEIDWSLASSVFIGTGFEDKMKVDYRLVEHFQKEDILFVIKPTPISVREYNRYVNNRKVGIFHLTC